MYGTQTGPPKADGPHTGRDPAPLGGWEAGTHLDKVQRGGRVLGPQGQHEGPPGPVDVTHAQHGGPQEARAPRPLVVQHSKQRLDLPRETPDLQAPPRVGSVVRRAAAEEGLGSHSPRCPPRPASLPETPAGPPHPHPGMAVGSRTLESAAG